MANMCWNSVEFRGKENNLKDVKDCFQGMIQRIKTFGNGVLPYFIEENSNTRYFFDIWEDGDNYTYSTKWNPNIQELVEIAKKYDVEFKVVFEELGLDLIGVTTYIGGELEEYILDADVISNEVEYDEEEDVHLYNGESWESYSELLEHLFEKEFGVIEF